MEIDSKEYLEDKEIKRYVKLNNKIYLLKGYKPERDYRYYYRWYSINNGKISKWHGVGWYTCLSHATRGFNRLRRFKGNSKVKLLPKEYKPRVRS